MDTILKRILEKNGNTPVKMNYGRALLTQDGGWFFRAESALTKQRVEILPRKLDRPAKEGHREDEAKSRD
jgi:hypothetical protein